MFWRICHVHLREMYILLLLHDMFFLCLLGSFSLKYSCSPTFNEFLSGWPIHYWRWGIEVLNIIALLSISPFRPMRICLIYLSADLGWLYIHDYYTFLMNWPLYHYVMILFSLVTVFVSKSVLSDITSYSCSLWGSNCMEYIFFLHPFTLNSCVYLKTEVNLEGSIILGYFNSTTIYIVIEQVNHVHLV